MLCTCDFFKLYISIRAVGIIFTELVNTLPLVTQNSNAHQLSHLVKILKWRTEDLVDVNNYLRESGYNQNVGNQLKSSSKSYAVTNTVAELRKVFPQFTLSMLDLVASCLQLNPANRKNAEQLLHMKFFTEGRFSFHIDKLLEIRIKNDKM
jgi:serine/threonine protein kinase